MRIRCLYLLAFINITFAISPLIVQADEINVTPIVAGLQDVNSDAVFSNTVLTDISRGSTPVVEIAASKEVGEPLLATFEISNLNGARIRSPYKMRKGQRERDISIGYGSKINIECLRDREEVDMIQVLPRQGRFRNSTQEILWEVPLTVFTKPETNFLGGVTLMFRQHLSSNRRFAPFVEFGPGLTYTNLKTRDLGGSFQISLQGGAGIRTALSEKSDLVVGARWFTFPMAVCARQIADSTII